MNLSYYCLQNNGKLKPIVLNRNNLIGGGITSPSVFNDGKQILLNVRSSNRVLYNGIAPTNTLGGKLYRYLYDRNADGFRINDIMGYIPEELKIYGYTHQHGTKFPVSYEFENPENYKIVKWGSTVYASGVSFDEKSQQNKTHIITMGSEKDDKEKRLTVDFCSKPWSPINDKPFYFLRGTNPAEVIKINWKNKKIEVDYTGKRNERYWDWFPGSQIIEVDNTYLAIVYEKHVNTLQTGTQLFQYYHRFVTWDKDWNLAKVSKRFTFLGRQIECCSGFTIDKSRAILTFSVDDTKSYILCADIKTIMGVINDYTE